MMPSLSTSCVSYISVFRVRAPLVAKFVSNKLCFNEGVSLDLLVKKLSVACDWYFPSTSRRYLHPAIRTDRGLHSRHFATFGSSCSISVFFFFVVSLIVQLDSPTFCNSLYMHLSKFALSLLKLWGARASVGLWQYFS